MKILQVTRETSADRRYGIGKSLLPICQALQARGHSVQYLTQEDLSPRVRAWLPAAARGLARLGRPMVGAVADAVAGTWVERLAMGRTAAMLAQREGFDIVHVHDPWMAWGYERACLRYRPARRSRWGFTEHGFGAYAQATWEEGLPCTDRLMGRLRRLESGVAARADFVVCPTFASRDQLARDLAITRLPSHWQVLPHARPMLELPGRHAARKALGVPEDSVQVLAIGRVNPVKRLDAVVRACAGLRRPIHLILLAGGGDANQLLALADGVPQLKLQVQEVDDVQPFLAAADVYVSAARNESFGMANLEAMLAGLPIIATAVGGVPEVLGDAAWLVAPGHEPLVEQLALALAEVLDNPVLRARLSAGAANRGRQWPSAAELGARYEAVYQSLA